jgi:hypothetical protein
LSSVVVAVAAVTAAFEVVVAVAPVKYYQVQQHLHQPVRLQFL